MTEPEIRTAVDNQVPGQLAPLRALLAKIRRGQRMTYTIATVTDDTPATLEYGGYRGLVLLDGDGVCVGQYRDLEEACHKVAQDHGVASLLDVATVPAVYEEYGPAWDVIVHRATT